jgi:hypothetical protein
MFSAVWLTVHSWLQGSSQSWVPNMLICTEHVLSFYHQDPPLEGLLVRVKEPHKGPFGDTELGAENRRIRPRPQRKRPNRLMSTIDSFHLKLFRNTLFRNGEFRPEWTSKYWKSMATKRPRWVSRRPVGPVGVGAGLGVMGKMSPMSPMSPTVQLATFRANHCCLLGPPTYSSKWSMPLTNNEL